MSAPERRHTRFEAVRLRLEAFDPGTGWRLWLYEFLLFGFKQGWACLFGGLLLALLLGTHLFYPDSAALHRYDFLTLVAIAIQAGMLAFRLETWREARVILIFHIVGTVMELFKTQAGSWTYPEASVLHVGAVPVFSGFMYAAVGSYIARVWRIFDIRWGLFAATALIFWRTRVHFRNWRVHRWMPLLVGFGLVVLFIWFAENIATFANAWNYPGQENGWRMVSIAKYGSWYLLMLISFVLVTLAQPVTAPGGDRR